MTRPGGAKTAVGGIAELFATSVDAAVYQVLRDAGTALVKSEILNELVMAGVPRSRADDAWSAVQKRLRLDKRVITEKVGQSTRYRWNPDPVRTPTPLDALAMLVEGRHRGEREALAVAIRAALVERAQVLDVEPVEAVSINRLRQVELDTVRELAGLAIDVEEQIAKAASAKAIVHRVRSRMKRLRLEATEKAGETVAFDRTRHQPIRSGISDGAPVLVIRPGYIWRVPGDELVIEKPVVQD